MTSQYMNKPFFPRVLPLIYSGNSKLEICETVCFFANKGLDLRIPTGSSGNSRSEMVLIFRFSESEEKGTKVKHEIKGNNVLKIELINFNNSLPMGTTSPITFGVGKTQFLLLFNGHAITSQGQSTLINLNISIFAENANE